MKERTSRETGVPVIPRPETEPGTGLIPADEWMISKQWKLGNLNLSPKKVIIFFRLMKGGSGESYHFLL